MYLTLYSFQVGYGTMWVPRILFLSMQARQMYPHLVAAQTQQQAHVSPYLLTSHRLKQWVRNFTLLPVSLGRGRAVSLMKTEDTVQKEI